MGDRTELVKFRVTPEFKTEIQQYVDESTEADSMAVLCRKCLRKEMFQPDTEPGVSVTELRNELDEYIGSVENELLEVKEITTEIEQSVGAGTVDAVLLAQHLREKLPVWKTEDDVPDLDDLHRERTDTESMQDASKVSTANAYANVLEGVDVHTVRRALAECVESYPEVDVIGDGLNRRYYRRREVERDAGGVSGYRGVPAVNPGVGGDVRTGDR